MQPSASMVEVVRDGTKPVEASGDTEQGRAMGWSGSRALMANAHTHILQRGMCFFRKSVAIFSTLQGSAAQGGHSLCHMLEEGTFQPSHSPHLPSLFQGFPQDAESFLHSEKLFL